LIFIDENWWGKGDKVEMDVGKAGDRAEDWARLYTVPQSVDCSGAERRQEAVLRANYITGAISVTGKKVDG
jgi:hypothetical protein